MLNTGGVVLNIGGVLNTWGVAHVLTDIVMHGGHRIIRTTVQ